MSIEALITDLTAAVRENTAAIKANGGNAAVNGPADDKVKKVTYFNIVDKKQVVKVDAGGERPLGGLEVTAAEAKRLDEKYKADAAKNATQTGAAGAQSSAAGSSSGTGTQSGSPSSDGPTFKDVTEEITKLSKKPEAEGGGRAAVVALLAKWKVKTFPEAQGKKSNAELIADIRGEEAPAEEAGADDLSGLGL